MSTKESVLPLTEAPHKPRSSQWYRRILALVCLTICALVLVSFAQEDTRQILGSLGYHTLVRRSSFPRIKRETLSSGIQKPPVAPRVYTDTVEDLQKLVDGIIADEKAVVNRITKSVKPDEATFANTILPYILHENQVYVKEAVLVVYPAVSPDPKIQDASTELATKLDNSIDQTFISQDFYNLVDAVYRKQRDDPWLDRLSRGLIYSLWGDFYDTGMNISAGENRKRYEKIGERLRDLSDQYDQAIVADNTTLWLTPEELNGTNAAFISSLEKGTGKNKGKVSLPVKFISNYLAVMQDCTNATTRHRAFIAYNNQAPSNVARLKEAIVLRDERARLYNFKNFATQRIQNNIAKTPEAVDGFLKNIQTKLTPTAVKHTSRLKDLKKADVGKADHLFLWDITFYDARQDETEYHVDNDLVAEYFPVNTTIQAILDLYAQLYGLKFIKIDGKDRDQLASTGKGSDLTWHPDVTLYAVWNDGYRSSDDNGEDGGFVGYIYIDLFYRQGKRGSGAFESRKLEVFLNRGGTDTDLFFALAIEPGFEEADGSRHYPACALVTNFHKSTTAKPSLMRRDEAQTLMHELGHGMHQLTSRVKYARNHGPGATPPDFFEAPSQMMENFAFIPAVLKRLSKHWSYVSPAALVEWKKEQSNPNAKQPPEKIPDRLVDDILKNKNARAASTTLVQVFYAMYDMAVYEPASHEAAKAIDTTYLWNHMRKDITKIDGPEVLGKGWHWGHRQTLFPYLMRVYQASYYAYLWSQVYCVDLFYTGFKNDPFSRTAGTRFRRIVLEPGGTKDLEGILEEFLGHKPSDKPFFDNMGIRT